MGGWYRDPDGRIPDNTIPASLDGAPVLRWLIVAFWLIAGAVGVAGWICLIWLSWWWYSF